MEYLNDQSFIDELMHQLRFDAWHVDDAIKILCCIDPASEPTSYLPLGVPDWRVVDASPFGIEEVPKGKVEFDRQEALLKYNQIWEIWRSGIHAGLHPDEHYPPSYFIEWAVSKDIEIPWMNRAVELGLAPTSKGTSKEFSYSTPHLNILKAAAVYFFEPRRYPDAKKEAVVEWIKARMKDAAIPDSDNIATAIFTIIKPTDHDPRKRRG